SDVAAMFGFEYPVVGGGQSRIDDALMCVEVFGRTRRRATFEVRWRRDQIAPHRAKPPGDQRARLELPDPQRQLDALLHQIDEALAEADVQTYPLIGSDIFGDDGHQIAPAERRGQADPQRPARPQRTFLDVGPRQIEASEDLAGQIVDAVALRRRLE